MRILHIFFFFFFITSFVSAQLRIKISGVVTDTDGSPIELVHVRTKNGVGGTFTDFKGKYELPILSSDTVDIVYSSIGYKNITRRLFAPPSDITMNIRMTSNIEALGEVHVTSHRVQPNTMEKIDMTQAKLMPDASGNSVEALISSMAGVNSNNELSSQYSVRGGNFDENAVYVNGIEVYRPLLVRSGQQEGLSFINPDMVSSISFSSGGYSAEYGDKMSSVLDITYKKPEEFEGSASISLQGASASVGQSIGKFTQVHGIRYKTNSLLLGTLDTKGEYNPNFFDYQAYLNFNLNKKLSLGVLANISQNNYNFRPESRSTSFGTIQDVKQFKVYFDGWEKDIFRTFFGAATLNYVATEKTSLQLLLSAFATDETETYDIRGEYWLDQSQADDSQGQGSLGVGAYQEHARNKLNAKVIAAALKGVTNINSNSVSYGINLQKEIISDRVAEWEMRDSSGYSIPNADNAIDMYYALRSKYTINSLRVGAYIQDTYRFNTSAGRIIATGGIRASYWSFNKEFILSPRASIGFIPENINNFTARFATGVYYQSPFYKEFRDTLRNSDGNLEVKLNDKIKSQRSIHFILGADYSFRAMNRPFKLTTELYYKKFDDIIPYEVDNVRIRYYGENCAKGHIAGLDFKLYGEYVPGTDSWLTFSLMQAKEEINGIKVPRPTEQRYSIGLFFNDYIPMFPKFKISLKAIWNDGLPFGAPSGGRSSAVFRTPAYRRVDIGLSRCFNADNDRFMNRGMFSHLKNIWLGVDAFNLLDIDNVNSYYWVNTVVGDQYAVPNYLTGRLINVRLTVDF